MEKKKQNLGERIARSIFPGTFEKIDSLAKVNAKLMEINDRAVSMLGTNFQHDKYPLPMTWFFNPGFGIPRNVNTSTLREFGKTAWVRMCVDTIIELIAGLDWDIMPKEEFAENENYDEELKDKIRDFFLYPNPDEDYMQFIKKLLEDILILDAGVVVKIFSKGSKEEEKSYRINEQIWENGKVIKELPIEFKCAKPKGNELDLREIHKVFSRNEYDVVPETYEDGTPTSELKALLVANGETILKAPNAYGMLPDDRPAYYQYCFVLPGGKPVPFFKREIMYMSMNPRSNDFYGFSPIQGMYNILETLTNGTRFNKALFDNMGVPDLIVYLEGMPRAEIDKIKRQWQQELFGKAHKTLFTSHKFEMDKLGMSATDLQWLDGQKFYMKLVMALYHINQGELGFTDELNKHSSDAQAQSMYRKMILPLTKLIESKFNNEIIPEFYLARGMPVETEFKYIVDDVVQDQKNIENQLAMVNSGIITPNEMRKDMGLDDIEGGDELKGQFNSFGSPFGIPEVPKRDQSEPEESKKKSLAKSLDMEDEAKGYNDFLERYYKHLESKVISALKDKKFGIKKNLTKSLPEFLSSIIHYFDPEPVKSLIRSNIKRTFTDGIEKGEDETGVQVGYMESFDPRIEQLTEEQIYGYVMSDGKRWFGITGINQLLKNNIYDTVTKDMTEGKSISQISKDIKELFSEFKDWKATRIARTETTRIANQGSYAAYVESGLKGKREWLATNDSRTCPICRRLHGQKVELNKAFEDPDTGKQYYHAPVHPNCRCSMVFVPD